MEKKLEVKNLQISFRTQSGLLKAVRDISFDLYKGETLAIVGESGSGKSVTSKAIIGILAGNAVVEGGEILYDGQDLLKISEDDFHKIRGDKISMIFQDPLSSLNPIMKVGKQLTEAMILNGKARQKSSRKDFNSRLKLLNRKIDEVSSKEDIEKNHLMCKTFDDFCIMSTKLELTYNNAQNEAISLDSTCENLEFLIDKNQKIEYKKELVNILNSFKKTFHHYVVNENDKTTQIISNLDELIKSKNIRNADDGTKSAIKNVLIDIREVLDIGIKNLAPNFFRLGYYVLKNPDASIDELNVRDLDEMTLKYLDENFMISFIDQAALGIEKAHFDSINAKKEILKSKDEYLSYFSSVKLKKIEAFKMANKLIIEVKKAINYLSIHKRNIEYSFESTLIHELNVYFNGLKQNPINERKYSHQKSKFDALVAKGKRPTWQVTPAVIVDLELAHNNILKTITDLFNSYEKQITSTKTKDFKKDAIELMDYFKELASRVVYRVTKKLAKARALELLEEVGIPEPAIRYNQYPFEFSGGMRQRIVIAIALSANPDVLICDEPTTALDVTIQSQILELINKIKKERNLSVIFITHDLGVVANMADRIAVMYAGKIVEYGTVDDIFYDPKHPYTWALLTSMPDLDTKEKLEAIPGTPPNLIYPPVGDAFAERNKYAMEIDFEEQPPLFKVSDTHYAATWLLHPNAPKVKPPKIILDRIKRMKKLGGK